ncbi:argK family protein [Mycobacterium kansasii]|uniref:ArgK family protein n=1 Tax=Mycobacterium kansasii TaxID=1768 RepID=A0A1V3X5H5_MYCKA|nr:argK family protein [Mycobacterium kansasii]
MDIADLIARARNGSPRATGRLLSLVEGERRDEVLAAIDPAPVSEIRVVGITGPPGAGKSTTIAALVGAYRERGRRVGYWPWTRRRRSAGVPCSAIGSG